MYDPGEQSADQNPQTNDHIQGFSSAGVRYDHGFEEAPIAFGPAFEGAKGRMDALYVAADPLANSSRVRINTLALAARLPTMQGVREYVDAGGLMSYGPNIADGYRRAADYVDKILRGAKPGDIPVEQPTKFDLVLNQIGRAHV